MIIQEEKEMKYTHDAEAQFYSKALDKNKFTVSQSIYLCASEQQISTHNQWIYLANRSSETQVCIVLDIPRLHIDIYTYGSKIYVCKVINSTW